MAGGGPGSSPGRDEKRFQRYDNHGTVERRQDLLARDRSRFVAEVRPLDRS